MHTTRENEVTAIANEIGELSKDYYLAHSIVASEKKIENVLKGIFSEEIQMLKKKIRDTDNPDKIKELSKDKEILETLLKTSRSHIFVDYIENMSSGSARVIKTGHHLTISLPKCLNDKSDDYKLKQLRKLIAHELGHIVLHTKEVIAIDSLNGSKEIKEPDKEQEADYFAEQLIKHRREHYTMILTEKKYLKY